MKKATLICLGCILLTGGILLLYLQTCSKTTAPVQFVSDMVSTPTVSQGQAPPPGAIPYAPPDSAPPQEAQLYSYHCAMCHGNSGTGHSYVAQYPGMPTVADLTNTDTSANETLRIIRQGRGAMPAFGTRLSPAATDALRQHLFNTIRKK